MDFFSAQEQARKRTSWLVVLYLLAVAGIIAAVYLLLAVVWTSQSAQGATRPSLWMPELFMGVAIGVSGVVLCGSLFKTMQLARGGAVVARALGGRPIAPDTRDEHERKLLNVVEEMALAAGLAVPQLFLLADEPGINAFAAGFSPRDAAIGVTRGCLERLSRDELQGVIAHEFSHIVNGDMRLNIRLMGVLFGILMLTMVGHVLLRAGFLSGGVGRSRDGRKQGVNPLPIIGLALIAIGYIGVFFANLIKSAISRQREFLSDAVAVQYTRNPAGIAGALKKIGGLAQGARVRNPHAVEASHLFFGEALSRGMDGLFATHPPLQERIRRLDPAFNPVIAGLMSAASADARATGPALGFAPGAAGAADLTAAAALLHRVPEALLSDAHTASGARALVYALLESAQSDVRAGQEALVGRHDPQARQALAVMRERLAGMPRKAWLPLAELAVPALRTLSATDYARFSETVRAMMSADLEIDLFEFMLSQMILRHVEPAFGRVSVAPVRHHTVAHVLPACATVIATLARQANGSEAAETCYLVGMRKLGSAAIPPFDAQQTSLARAAEALRTLAESAPAVKRRALDACAACILADGRVVREERELLRAIADAMDVSMPPLAT